MTGKPIPATRLVAAKPGSAVPGPAPVAIGAKGSVGPAGHPSPQKRVDPSQIQRVLGLEKVPPPKVERITRFLNDMKFAGGGKGCRCEGVSIAWCVVRSPACGRARSLARLVVESVRAGRRDDLVQSAVDEALKSARGGGKPHSTGGAVYRVLAGASPVRGPASALVTAVQFGDFESPYARRIAGRLLKLRKTYGKDLRIVFKQMPLPFHRRARLAAEAALAAQAQGKFWQYHELLFANQNRLGRKHLVRYAKKLSLDMKKFNAALKGGRYRARIAKEIELARRLGLTSSTSPLVVNGRIVDERERLENVIERERQRASRAVAGGAKRAGYYERLMAGARPAPPLARPGRRGPSPGEAGARPPVGKQPKGLPVSFGPAGGSPKVPPKGPINKVHKVPIGTSPVRGGGQALVTVVVFSEFENPFAARAKKPLESLLSRHRADLRVAFKHSPLEIHRNSQPAAQAAVAAHAQGRFWQYHDLLLANPTRLSRKHLLGYARKLGLDMKRFEKDMASTKARSSVAGDLALGNRVGVAGIPSYFVNGRAVGAGDVLTRVVSEELERARQLLQAGVKRAQIYSHIMKAGGGRR